MARIADLLGRHRELAASSDTPRLDAELILGEVLGVSRSHLYTWPDRELDTDQIARFAALFARRARGEPIAHLLGRKEFWSLPLRVNASTLIPRPETELLVEVALRTLTAPVARVLDLGTGTGAIALALASSRPDWRIVAVDRVAEAVALAETNRVALNLANVQVCLGDWFALAEPTGGAHPAMAEAFDLIVSNPPYVAADDVHLRRGDLRFEPRTALVAADDGLADLAFIIANAHRHLAAGGWLMVEHGADQGEVTQRLLKQQGYTQVLIHRDVGGRERVAQGRWRVAPAAR